MNNYSYSCLKVSYVDTFYPSVSIDLIPKRLGRGRFKLWKPTTTVFVTGEWTAGVQVMKRKQPGNALPE